MTRFRGALCAFLLVALPLFAACSSSSTTPAPKVQRLFTDDDNVTISIFTLPVSNASTASATFTGASGPSGLKFDSMGKLYVADFAAGSVQIFNPPLSSSTTAAVTISALPHAEDVALDASGNLYVALTGNPVEVFNPPFTNASTPAFAITTGISSSFGLA